MNVQLLINALVEIFLSAVSGILIITVSWLLLRNDLRKYILVCSASSANELDTVTKNENNHLFQLRLQAYERMIVFVDRLNPSNLFLRLYEPVISASELQARIPNEINAGYQHNISQQLYIKNSSRLIIQKLSKMPSRW